jgi:hypothetical protein
MYPRNAALRVAGMIWAGLIDLDLVRTTVFPLARVSEAAKHAAKKCGSVPGHRSDAMTKFEGRCRGLHRAAVSTT